MKKLISLLLAFAMLIILAVPCFAVDAAKFSVNIVSESDSEVVLSVNYEGGSVFSNYDYELKYKSDRLKPQEAVDGDGMFEFIKYAKKNNGLAVTACNPKNNPIKGNYAGTLPFKVINGNDLTVITFQKLSKDDLSESDFSFSFTNCQLNESKIPSIVSTPWSEGSIEGNDAQDAEGNNGAADGQDGAVSGVDSDALNGDAENQDAGADDNLAQPDGEQDGEIGEVEKSSDSMKKKIWIPAIAICVLFVAAAVAVFIKKRDSGESE